MICNTIDAALAGQGTANLLSYQVALSVAEGRLRPILDDSDAAPMPVHIVSSEGRRAPAKVRAFIDQAVARLQADPMVDPGRA